MLKSSGNLDRPPLRPLDPQRVRAFLPANATALYSQRDGHSALGNFDPMTNKNGPMAILYLKKGISKVPCFSLLTPQAIGVLIMQCCDAFLGRIFLIASSLALGVAMYGVEYVEGSTQVSSIPDCLEDQVPVARQYAARDFVFYDIRASYGDEVADVDWGTGRRRDLEGPNRLEYGFEIYPDYQPGKVFAYGILKYLKKYTVIPQGYCVFDGKTPVPYPKITWAKRCQAAGRQDSDLPRYGLIHDRYYGVTYVSSYKCLISDPAISGFGILNEGWEPRADGNLGDFGTLSQYTAWAFISESTGVEEVNGNKTTNIFDWEYIYDLQPGDSIPSELIESPPLMHLNVVRSIIRQTNDGPIGSNLIAKGREKSAVSDFWDKANNAESPGYAFGLSKQKHSPTVDTTFDYYRQGGQGWVTSNTNYVAIRVPTSDYKITITYEASDPASLQWIPGDGTKITPTAPEGGFWKAAGLARLWAWSPSSGTGYKQMHSILTVDGAGTRGQFIPSGVEIDGSLLGSSPVLYLEGIHPGNCKIGISVTMNFFDGVQTQTMTSTDDITIPIAKTENTAAKCDAPAWYASAEASQIDHVLLTYRHDGVDYHAGGAAGCAPCGTMGAVGQEGDFQIQRVHRYDIQDFPGQFGHGVFLHGFPMVQIQNGDARLWDPSFPVPVTLMDQGGGQYGDPTTHRIASLSPASGGQSTLEYSDGARVIMEWFVGPRGAICARPIQVVSKSGRPQVTFTYIHPVGSLAAPAGGAVDRRGDYWQLRAITDAYRVGATITAGTYVAGGVEWSAITGVNLPTGGLVQYEYQDPILNTKVQPHLLTAVQYPDGNQTTIAFATEATTQDWLVTIHDAGAEGVHRDKVVRFAGVTTEVWWPWQVKQVQRIDGSVVWRGLPSYNDEGDHVTYIQTTSEVFRLIHRTGAPLRTEVATTPGTLDAIATLTWAVREKYTCDEHFQITGRATPATQASIQTTYNARGQYLVTTWSDESYEENRYDSVGNLTWTQSRGTLSHPGLITEREYDSGRRLVRETTGVGTSQASTRRWTYNSRGLKTAETDPLGGTTEYAYDALDRLVSITEPADGPGRPRAQRQIAYDALGRLSSTKDAQGRLVQYGYDLLSRRVLTTYADGTTEEITYGTGVDANRIVSLKDRRGFLTQRTYDAAGRVATETAAAGTAVAQVTSTAYAGGGQRVVAEVRSGSGTTTAYDARGRLSSRTMYARQSGGLTTSYTNDDADRQIMETDAFSRRRVTVYDGQDRVVRVAREAIPGGLPSVDPAVVATLTRPTALNADYLLEDTSYDDAGRVTTRTDARGIVTSYAYDDQDRVASETVASGTSAAWTTSSFYDAAGNLIRMERPDPRGIGGVVSTKRAYTPRGLLASMTESVGMAEQATTTYTYTKDRLQETVTNTLGQVTTNQYGVCCARLTGTVDALGALTQIFYDPAGHVLSRVDPNGLTTSTTYDALGRPSSQTNGAGEKSQIVYDDNLVDGVGLEAKYPGLATGLGFGLTGFTGAVGHAVEMRDPLGACVVTVQDGLGRTVRVRNALGQVTTTTYDQVALVTEPNVDGSVRQVSLVGTTVTDPLGRTTQQWADGLGRVRRVVDGTGAVTVMWYDAGGNRCRVRDANGSGDDVVYDARNRVTKKTEVATTPRVEEFGYDLDGNPKSHIDGSLHEESWTYDTRGRKITAKDANQAVTTFGYDALGNLLTITDAEGGVTRYTYDQANRLVREEFPGTTGGVRTYQYDAGGRLKKQTQTTKAAGVP